MSGITLKVDSKGRVTIPNKLRENLDIKPGDTLYLNSTDETILLKKAIDPFDMVALEALKEHREGKTISIEDLG